MKENTVIRIDKEEAVGVAASPRGFDVYLMAFGEGKYLGHAAVQILYRLKRIIADKVWGKEGHG